MANWRAVARSLFSASTIVGDGRWAAIEDGHVALFGTLAEAEGRAAVAVIDLGQVGETAS